MSETPIQHAPPSYDANPSNMNEKHEYTHVNPEQPQQTYQQAPPQQYYHQTASQQGFPQSNASKNNYQIATPLASLQQGPAPVDCPVCGVREMTRTEFFVGDSVLLLPLLGLYSLLGQLVQGL
ncbi:hypothetical protein EG329_010332 [Mollisiaceae sp. DMI_Dod_QoI]|nr:hypothetical protein EG329_010332 [Helotiales sp. DMI_Dod_QoI]